MRTFTLSLIVLISCTCSISAQNWTLVNSNTTDHIIDISFKDNNFGFYLTNTGKLFNTQDNGSNWNFIHQDTDLIAGQIAVTNDSIFWYATDLNGIHYKSQSSLTTFNFTKNTIETLPMRPIFWNNEIWDVLKVNQLLGGSAPSNFVVEEFAVSDNYIWATNSTKIYYSDDFGLTWQEHQFTPPTLNSGPYQSFYNGTNDMVAITQYPTSVYQTTDGANWTWHQPYETDPEATGIYFYFVDFDNFLAYNFFGATSKIYNSINGGQTFNSEVLIDIPSGIYSKNNNNETIFIYGKNGMLYKSTNAGGLLSTNDLKHKDEFKIYPNPTSEIINIEHPNYMDIQNIKLVDIQGKTIKTFINDFKTLSIENVVNGNYFLIIQTKNHTITKKIIVD